MPLAITRTTDAASEPITSAEAKSHMRVDHNADDTLIAALIKAARQYLEEISGRALINQTWTLKLDGFPGCGKDRRNISPLYTSDRYRWRSQLPIILPRAPLSSVSSIAYVDEDGASQTWGSSNYVVDSAGEPGAVYPAEGVEYPDTDDRPNAVTVTYVAGYGAAASAVPQPIKQALLLLVAQWYEHREVSLVGTMQAALPFTVDALMGPYRVHWMA